MDARFRDRNKAGQLLAAQLSLYANRLEVLVLGLPRGGVPVAAQVAKALHVPMDICLVRKLGVPGHEELAMGAIASGGVRVLNDDVVSRFHISRQTIEEVTACELQELQRRDRVYRGDRPPLTVRDRTIILIDDGLATGSTMRAAISAIQEQGPQQIVVAVPVAAPDICQEIQKIVDRVVCIKISEPLYAIGCWYKNFAQTTDTQVCELLHQNFADCSSTSEVDEV